MIETILKRWSKSKTVIFGLLLVFFGGLQTFLPSLNGLISPVMYGGLTFASGMIVIVLRYFTTLPLADK